MIHYIAYSNLGEFYTLQEVCHMLEMSKDELRKNCEKYNVKPSRNEIGDWGLPCHDLCRLHNYLYKAEKSLTDTLQTLPDSLEEAKALAAASPFMKEILGESLNDILGL